MARKIDPAVELILKGFDLKPADVLWDCHGTWCMYHRAVEQIAAKQGITFDQPMVVEANGTNKSVALCVTGRFKDRSEWSIGEASPGNNKNAYCWAMAEKRAKDRVVLKLIGLHGLVYGEDEMPEELRFAPKSEPDHVTIAETLKMAIDKCETVRELDDYGGTIADKVVALPKQLADEVRHHFGQRKKALKLCENMAA